MESHIRSITKAVTYRFLGFFVTMAIAWFITHDKDMAAKIGLADTFFKIFAYYAHERMWMSFRFGMPRPPDYDI
jgi:uncharacterized membrane protein